MIYNHQGVPIRQVLAQAALAVSERKRQRTEVLYERDVEGNRLYRILHTKLGDAYQVFRQVMRRTKSGPWNKAQENARRAYGRGPGMDTIADMKALNAMPEADRARGAAEFVEGQMYAQAVTEHGSQRKAAAALGISLGKLQRKLRKCA